MEHEILQKLAECMYSYKAYPTDEDFAEVATALINKHPCLREQGSSTGCGGWKNSLKFKMCNYRSKLCKAGCLDVSVNGGRRGKYSPEGQPRTQNIKKPRRDERNYLPDFPLGKDKISLEKDRELLVEEMRKRLPNKTLVAQKMDQTFPLRRKEIVETEPPVKTTMERWPALFTEREVRNLIVIGYLHLFHWLNDFLFFRFLQNLLGLPARIFRVNSLVNLTDTHPI